MIILFEEKTKKERRVQYLHFIRAKSIPSKLLQLISNWYGIQKACICLPQRDHAEQTVMNNVASINNFLSHVFDPRTRSWWRLFSVVLQLNLSWCCSRQNDVILERWLLRKTTLYGIQLNLNIVSRGSPNNDLKLFLCSENNLDKRA